MQAVQQPFMTTRTIHEWRVSILQGILYAIFGLGTLVVFSSLLDLVRQLQATPEDITIVVQLLFHSIAYISVILVTFIRSLGFVVRAAVPLVLLYGVGLIEVALFGTTGDALVLFFTITALATLLFGVRYGLGVLGLSMVILIVASALTPFVGLTASYERLADPETLGPVQLIFYLFLVAIVIIPTNYLLQGLQHSLAQSAVAADALEATNRVLEATNATLEQRVSERTAKLQQALETQAQQAQELQDSLTIQQTLTKTITALSLPIIPVRDDTLVVPLIGTIDTKRARLLSESLLTHIERVQARLVFLDVTGVVTIDTQVAQIILQITTATRLLGTQIVLVGIRPEVAQTLVTLGIDLSSVQTAATLQTGLAYLFAQQKAGITLQRKSQLASPRANGSP